MGIEKQLVAEKVRELQVKEYLNEALKRVGFSNAEIKRTPLGTRIILHVIRPGRIIGRGGSKIKQLTNVLQKRFKMENPHIEVKEVEIPELDAVIMAKRIASSLERGFHFKRVGHRALTRILEMGATGAEISITGKVPGKRARCWKFVGGYIKHCGEAADVYVREGLAVAYLKPGVVGVKVRIMPPDAVLPDAIISKKQKVTQVVVTEDVDDNAVLDTEAVKKKGKKTAEKHEVGEQETLDEDIIPDESEEKRYREKIEKLEKEQKLVRDSEQKDKGDDKSATKARKRKRIRDIKERLAEEKANRKGE